MISLHTRKFILSSVRKHAGQFLWLTALTFALKFLVVQVPLLTGSLVDVVASGQWAGGDGHLLFYKFIAIVVIALAGQIFLGKATAKFVQNLIYERSLEWVRRILSKDFTFFTETRIGQLAKATERGLAAHEKFLNALIQEMVPGIFEMVISMAAVYWLGGWTFSLAVLVLSACQIYLSQKMIQNRRATLNEVNDSEDEMFAEFYEVLDNGFIIKAERQFDYALTRLAGPMRRYADLATNLAFSGGILGAIPSLFGNLITMGLFAVILMTPLKMSAGEILALLAVASRMNSSLTQMIQNWRFLDQFEVDIKTFTQLLEASEFEREGVVSAPSQEVSDLVLQPAEGLPIKQALQIQQGQKVALVGTTGGGKSTLLNALAGFSAPAREHLYLNSCQVSQISSQEQSTAIKYCPQKSYLFSGPVYEGAFFSQTIQAGLRELLAKLDLVPELVNGERVLAEKAQNISGGEARRLTVARTLSSPAAFYLFDEPTTGLNPSVAANTWTQIFTKSQKAGLICATHDLETLPRFDRVLFMMNKDLVFDGTPAEFLKTKYAQELHGNSGNN